MSGILRTMSALLMLLKSTQAAVSFVSIGDWGGAGINGGKDYHKTNEVAVAKQLGKTATDLDAKFVINTGDNFYYCGVQNITDDLFKIDFEDVYTDKSLNVPWYGVLGNHDYAYDVESQFKYKSPNNDRWQLPDHYYTKRLLLGGSQYATFLFIDTNPCIAKYRASDPKGWDPCSGEYGECLQGPKQECLFNQHILAQNCSAQYEWFQHELAAIDEHDWVIVVGHHEADQIDVEDFTGAMLSKRIRLYLNGHTHALKHYQMTTNTDVDFFTTGAGSMVYTKDQDVCREAECLSGTHTPTELFYQRKSGFTFHTFSEDFMTLTTKALDIEGNVLHSFVTNKKASSGPTPGPAPGPPSPAPTPGPPAPPPEQGNCKNFGCGSFSRGQECQCNSFYHEHGDCCKDYDATCGGEQGNCKNYGCGSFSRGHKCQCNRFCHEHGDCCKDYDATCGGETEVVV